MINSRTMVGAAALFSLATLGGCGPYGIKGDRGLPPPPEDLAYPNLNRQPPDANRRLKPRSEQEKAKSDLLARGGVRS